MSAYSCCRCLRPTYAATIIAASARLDPQLTDWSTLLPSFGVANRTTVILKQIGVMDVAIMLGVNDYPSNETLNATELLAIIDQYGNVWLSCNLRWLVRHIISRSSAEMQTIRPLFIPRPEIRRAQ